MALPDEAGSAIDTTVPHSARIWTYWQGGKNYYPIDKELGDRYAELMPDISQIALSSRAFLRRAIRFLAGEAGVTQFLDVGTGLPTNDNTHEIAQRVNPRARIVYVDNDPLVIAHAHALLTSTPQGVTDFVDVNFYDTETVTTRAREVLDYSKPIALNFSGVLGHITDTEEARRIIRELMAPMCPGSYLAINDGTREPANERLESAQQVYNESGTLPYILRTRAEISSMFDGLEPVSPGLVGASHWRPDDPEADRPEVWVFVGVARKP